MALALCFEATEVVESRQRNQKCGMRREVVTRVCAHQPQLIGTNGSLQRLFRSRYTVIRSQRGARHAREFTK